MPQGKWAVGENTKQVAQQLFSQRRGCSAKCKETGPNGPEPFLPFAPSLASPNTKISSVLLQTSQCLVQSQAPLCFSDLLFHLLTPASSPCWASLGPTVAAPGSLTVTAFSELPAFVLRRNVSCTSYSPFLCFLMPERLQQRSKGGGHVLSFSFKRLRISRKIHPEKDA